MKIDIDEIKVNKQGTFLTIENLTLGTICYDEIYEVKFEDKSYYFKAIELKSSVVRNRVIAYLEQIGYYNDNFNHKSYNCINDFLVSETLDITLVTDKETLRKIEEESYWC